MSTPTNRLNALSAELKRRGVVDVKLCFNKACLATMPASEVASKVADFVQCYLDGAGRPVLEIGDARA